MKNNCASQPDACRHSFVAVRRVVEELDEVVDGYHFHPVVGSTRSAPSLDLKNGWFALCHTCLLGCIFGFARPDSP